MIQDANRPISESGTGAGTRRRQAGRPGGNVPEADFAKYDEAILKVVSQEYGLKKLPIMSRMDFGHTDPMFVIPYGLKAEIHCDERKLFIQENAVD